MPWIVPFIPQLIGAGATLGGSYLAGRRSPEEKAALEQQTRLLEIEEDRARLAREGAERGFARQEDLSAFTDQYLQSGLDFLGQGKDIIGKGLRTIDPALNYWNQILKGDRASTLSFLSPEINQITGGFEAARQASRALYPRGGASSAQQRRISEELIPSQIGGLLATSRPRAAQQVAGIGAGLSQIGLQTGQLGLGAGGVGTGIAGVETGLLGLSSGNFGAGAGSGLLNYGLRRSEQQYGFGKDLGSSIFDIIGLFTKGGGGGAPFPGGTGTGGSLPPYFPPNPRPGPPQLPPGFPTSL